MGHRLRLIQVLVGVHLLSVITLQARDLTFEERVEAQRAIERVYYAHQIGATRPFEEALPRAVLEKKVATYLRQSAALEELWRTSVTAEMLGREMERMVRQTRLPERLRELFASLQNDAFLVQECLARPVLMDRLTRNFFAFDERFHSGAREEAERLRGELLRLGVDAFGADSRRSEVDLIEAEPSDERMADSDPERRTVELSPEEYKRQRAGAPERAGEIGPVEEKRDAFVIRVVLEEGPQRARIASFAVGKRSWDDWWAGASPALDPLSVPAVASATSRLPLAELAEREVGSPGRFGSGAGPAGGGAAGAPCLPDDTWDNGWLDDPLDSRTGHTAVWTGGVMIVWGGAGGDFLDSGGRYDPATDTWTPTSTTGAPTARVGHTAVWTGSVMIVWGGSGNSGKLNTGGRYDPATDTWTPTSTDGPEPEGIVQHTAVWTGGMMVVWGGAGLGGYLDTGWRYDPATDTWTPTSTTGAPTARLDHTAVWTGNVMIVWGGYGGFGDLNTGGRYDPATDTWTPTSTTGAPTARPGYTAVWTGAVMVVWGGGPGCGFFGCDLVDTGGRYNPATDTWTPTSTASAPTPRRNHTAVWTGGKMVVWGGYGGEGLNTGGRYDPATDTWTPTSTTGAPTARIGHTAVWTGSEMIVWGGGSYVNTGGRYEPATDTWTPTSTTGAPTRRDSHTAVWTGGAMIVWGGYGGGPLDTGGRYALDNASDVDVDGDGVADACDNCRFAYNPTQADADRDGLGDACDTTVEEPLIEVRVSAPTDDAGLNPVVDCVYAGVTGPQEFSANEVYFGECYDGRGITSGFRFAGVSIPRAALVASAHLEFTVDGPYDDELSLTIAGEAAADARPFSNQFAAPLSDPDRPDNRPATTATVPWVIPAADHWEFHEARQTPDLTAVLREIVWREDWCEGNALAMIIRNAGPASGVYRHRRVFAIERSLQGSAEPHEVARLVVRLAPTAPVTVQVMGEEEGGTFNPRSKGVIPFAVLSTPTFDATTVDPSSAGITGVCGAREVHERGHFDDVDGDGRPDLVLHFDAQELSAAVSSDPSIVCLTAATSQGGNIAGCALVSATRDQSPE